VNYTGNYFWDLALPTSGIHNNSPAQDIKQTVPL